MSGGIAAGYAFTGLAGAYIEERTNFCDARQRWCEEVGRPPDDFHRSEYVPEEKSKISTIITSTASISKLKLTPFDPIPEIFLVGYHFVLSREGEQAYQLTRPSSG
jgi:hypothetical protein